MILGADFGLVMIERMKGPHQNRLCFLVTFFAQAKKVGRGQARPDRAYRQAGSREQETEVLREPLCTLCLRGYFTTETRRSQTRNTWVPSPTACAKAIAVAHGFGRRRPAGRPRRTDVISQQSLTAKYRSLPIFTIIISESAKNDIAYENIKKNIDRNRRCRRKF